MAKVTEYWSQNRQIPKINFPFLPTFHWKTWSFLHFSGSRILHWWHGRVRFQKGCKQAVPYPGKPNHSHFVLHAIFEVSKHIIICC